MKKHVSMVRFSEHISDILSYGGLVLCIVVFSILSQGRLFNAYNIKILVQAVCVYAIMAMGAIFTCRLFNNFGIIAYLWIDQWVCSSNVRLAVNCYFHISNVHFWWCTIIDHGKACN